MAFGILGAAAGVILVAVGVYMIFFLHLSTYHQGTGFQNVGIFTGIFFTVVGVLLFFLP